MGRQKKIKVLIVDDHAILRDGLERALNTNEVIGKIRHAASGKEAIEVLKKFEPEIVFMDIFMEEMDGYETSIRILEILPNTKIIAFSQFDDKEHITGMFSCGVKAYVVKTSGINAINEAIDAVLEGRNYFSKELSNVIFGDIKSQRESFAPKKLTQRELEILKYIIDGFKIRQIAEKLHLSERTIEWHKNNLMDKLEVDNIPSLVQVAIKGGFVN